MKEPKRHKWWQWLRRCNAIRLQRWVRDWLARKPAVPRKEPGGKMYWGGILDPKCEDAARVDFAKVTTQLQRKVLKGGFTGQTGRESVQK